MIQPCSTPSLTGCTYIYIFIYFASHPFNYHECVNESVIPPGIVNRSNSNAPLTQMLKPICICGTLTNAFWKGGPLLRDDNQRDNCTLFQCEYVDVSKRRIRADQNISTSDGSRRPRPVLDRSSHLFHRKTFGLEMALELCISSPELSIVGRLGNPSIGTNRISVMTPSVASMMNVS